MIAAPDEASAGVHGEAGGPPPLMPEPTANRAQFVAGSTIARWLEAVIDRDRNGYAVVAGSRKRFIVLYVDADIHAVAETRADGSIDSDAALQHLLGQAEADRFAMTHRLPRGIAVALTGLFHPPAVALHLPG
jgi:hypothetical protein